MTPIEKFRLAAEAYLRGVFTGMSLLGGGESSYLDDDDDGLVEFAHLHLDVPKQQGFKAYEAAFEKWIEDENDKSLVDLFLEALVSAGSLPQEAP